MFWWLNELIDSPLYSFSGPSVISDIIQGLDWQVGYRDEKMELMVLFR
jgi:hypothetical protein